MWQNGTKIEKNRSYVLGAASVGDGNDQYFYETICEEGRRVSVWRIVSAGAQTESSVSTSTHLTLSRTMWYLEGDNAPFQYGPQETITFDPVAVGWDLYDPCRSRYFPLVPMSSNSLIRAPPVADCIHGVSIRIGGVVFSRMSPSNGGNWRVCESRNQRDGNLKRRTTRLYWDNVMVHGPFKVLSRRVLVNPASLCSDTQQEDVAKRRQAESKARQTANGRSRDDSSGLSEDSDEKLGNELTEGPSSSAEEYWTLGSAESNVDSAQDEDERVSTSTEQSEGEASSGGRIEMDSDVDSNLDFEEDEASDKTSPNWDLSSDSGSATGKPSSRSSLNSETSNPDEDADDEADSGDESDSDADQLPYQPGIVRQKCSSLQCDHCGVLLNYYGRGTPGKPFYQCSSGVCARYQSWDICSDCFRKGLWCADKKHQMRLVVVRKQVLVTLEILSREDSRTCVSIAVTRSRRDVLGSGEGQSPESREESVFRYTSDPSTSDSRANLLHSSGPVIHPTLPLLVYPLEGTKLLFANLDENTYLTYRVSYDETEKSSQGERDKHCPIATVSMGMHFSSCGRYLYVARVTAAANRVKAAAEKSSKRTSAAMGSTDREKADIGAKTTARLFLQIITVRLSHTNPCSGLPRTLTTRQGVALGTWQAAAVLMLPYKLTWTDRYLYVSMVSASLMLCIFRVPMASSSPESSSQIEGPAEETMSFARPVPLPRSARFRPVYFYPAVPDVTGSCAKVILGSTHGDNAGMGRAQPPAVVYLRTETGKGGEAQVDWIPAEEAVLSRFKDLENGGPKFRANDPLLEDFDADSDCDLIMPMMDFQR